MGYSEYPHTNYHEYDFHEMIRLYKELNEKYQGTLDSINRLNDRLTKWEQDGTKYLSDMVHSAQIETQNKVDQKLADMQKKYDDAITKLVANTNLISADLKAQLDANFAGIAERIDQFEKDVDNDIYSKFIVMNGNMETIASQIEAEITSTVEESLASLDTSLSKKVDDLREEVNEIREWTTDNTEYAWDNVYSLFGMSALNWYNYPEMTCELWNELELTCTQFYIMGSVETGFVAEQQKVLSPFSGNMEPLETIFFELIAQLNIVSLTAEEYDNMCLTAEQYDNLLLEAHLYDWKGEHNDF